MEVQMSVAEPDTPMATGVVGWHRVLAFCPWQQRAAAAALSRDMLDRLGYSPSGQAGSFLWRFLLERLAEEHNMHVPLPGKDGGPPPGVADSWRSLFLELFPRRRQLDGSMAQDRREEGDAEEEHFSIKVAARFRAAGNLANVPEEQSIVLPLHQKVQMVRELRGCSRAEALQLIMRERGTQAMEDPFVNAELWDGAGDGEGEEGQRRPGSNSPAKAPGAAPGAAVNEEDDVEVEDEQDTPEIRAASNVHVSILAVREDAGSVLAVAPGVGLRDFTFNHVFSERAAQSDAYSLCAQRLVMDFLNGMNASVICYGQTGSGKTYTMFGPPGKASPEQQGVVPRACEEVLRSIHERRARGLEVELGLSYVEVFGSEVSDLLREGRVVGQGLDGRYAQVRATDRVGHRYVLDGHTEFRVESWEEVQALLECGDRAKRLAATAMNERSTRAHTLLVLTLTQTLPSGYQVRSRLFLADLGGSEKVSKSKADAGTVAPVLVVGGIEEHRVGWREYYQRRQRIQETLQINKGLFALKKVIEALHMRSQMREQGVPQHMLPYVPYQDSKLTMILKDALGGNSKTLVFCTASMDPSHALESLQTLRFGERCAEVQQQASDNKAASVQAALRQLAEEIKAVEAEIVRKERWETKLVRRRDVDTVAGAFGEGDLVVREELIPTSVLVGAEKEREHLERLLQRQLDLQGLSGALVKDYREMAAREADDGGRGRDFREKDRFKSKMKAKDFEEEVVLADALRFLFRKAARAPELFGETPESVRRRLPPSSLHENYYKLADWLRTKWEDEAASGAEKRSFGKAMMDFCQELTATFKEAPAKRDEVIEDLVAQVPGLDGKAAASAGDVAAST